MNAAPRATPIFIHGAGCTAQVFEDLRGAFAPSHAPNLPGHAREGESSTITEFAEFIEAYAEALGAPNLVLCGHSMGGAIALEVALRGVIQLRALIVLGSGARLRVAPAILDGLRANFEATAQMVASYSFAEATPARIDGSVAQMRAVGAAQTIRDFEACNAFDALERLELLRLPVLALTGEKDRMMPPKHAQSLAERIPGAQARIISDAGHYVMVEQPQETRQAISAFLQGL